MVYQGSLLISMEFAANNDMTGISGLSNNIGNCLGGIDLFVEKLSILMTGRSGGKYFCNSKLSIYLYIIFYF